MRRLCYALIPTLLVGLAGAGWLGSARADDERPLYPPTRNAGGGYSLHGQHIQDPYRWLEVDDSEEVEAWDLAQAKLLRDHLDPFPRRAELKRTLDAEFGLGGIKSLPTFEAGMRWHTYRPKGANQPILYRLDEAGTQTPQPILNPNRWAGDGTSGLKAWHVSPNGRYVAYRRDDKGSEETTLYIRDNNSGKVLPESIDRTKFASVVWLPDNTGFFYNRMPDPGSVPSGQSQYHSRISFHEIGTLVLDDPVVYGKGRPMLEDCWMYRSSDRKQLFLSRGLPYKAVETFEATWADGALTLVPVIEKKDERSWVDKVGSTYILNTDRNTGRREIFTAERDAKGALPEAWTPVEFPRSDKGVIKDLAVVANKFLVCHIKDNLVSRLFVRPLAGGPVREITLPEPGSVGGRLATKQEDSKLWFTFESYARPTTNFRCDLAAKTLTLHAEDTLPTTVDPDELISVQTTYKSKDGTDIPIFLLHRKDLKFDGTQPVLLYGYGGFRVGIYPRFSRTRALWTAMGGVLAVASLRGGDEFGEAWHQAGCLENKQNVFDDFIAAADWLVSTGKAKRGRLAIQGRSNGGLLVAACLNQRPDLCRAAICGVPLTDMLRYHKFQYAKSWTQEYGDPDVVEQFGWIRPYSPYHNVKPALAYPAVLVTAGLKDGRVNAFHARKIVARWQARSISMHPIYLRIDRKGGHGAAGLARRLSEVLDEWSFLLTELDGEE